MSLFDGIIERVFRTAVKKQVDLAVRALDDSHDLSYRSNTYPRDRYSYDRDEVLTDALEAWRVNPIARRIVGMVTQYVVGGGIMVESKHKKSNRFLAEWWDHPLNRLGNRVNEWVDELTRTGDLILLISTDLAGMSYVRALPSADVQDIETAENDLSQELFIVEKPSPRDNHVGLSLLEGRRWPVYDQNNDAPGESGSFDVAALHYAVNRPVGAKFGESDLAPMLRWMVRYAAWLEDRARLNRFRNTFLFWVKARFSTQAEKLERQAELNRNPPPPGSILVTDESESWSVLSPELASFEANEDGLALKKMISVGAGFPLHFLSEPESATRTTAEASGGPTFRNLQQRQEFMLAILEDLARLVLRRRKFYERGVNPDSLISITGTDISARDNSSLAKSAAIAISAFANLRDRNLIDDAELLRLAYRFAGEAVDLEELLKRGQAAPPTGREPVDPAPGGGTAEGNTPAELQELNHEEHEEH